MEEDYEGYVLPEAVIRPSKKQRFRRFLESMLPEDTYVNAHRPWGQDRDIYIHKDGNGLYPLKIDRFEDMGFTQVKPGKYRYKVSESTKNQLKQEDPFTYAVMGDDGYEYRCAATANVINKHYNRPTKGDAWTRQGVYGTDDIVVAPYNKKDILGINIAGKARRLSKQQARYVKRHIDDADVQLRSGDIVDMRYKGSSYTDKAWNQGDKNRANTHTGVIVQTGPKKEDTFVVHNVGSGGLQMVPIGDALGVNYKTPYITGIRRPRHK